MKNKADLYQETTFATVSCQQCGKPFTSYKELNYAIEVIKQQSDNPQAVQQKLQVLHTCPECKRQNSLDKTADMEAHMRVKLLAFKEPKNLNFERLTEQRETQFMEQNASQNSQFLAGGK